MALNGRIPQAAFYRPNGCLRSMNSPLREGRKLGQRGSQEVALRFQASGILAGLIQRIAIRSQSIEFSASVVERGLNYLHPRWSVVLRIHQTVGIVDGRMPP